MKYLKYILLVILAACFFQSCEEDFLNIVPNDRLSYEIFWKTDQDAVLSANAVYTFLENAATFVDWDAMTDIGHITQSWRNESLHERGLYSSSSVSVFDYWERSYKGIRSANDFFANIDRVEIQDQVLINNLKGEVKVLRAYFYIQLATLFGDVPLVTTTITFEESRLLTRTAVAQVWDYISQELTDAAALLPTTPKNKGRITKGTALALKARAMLYAGRYQEAINAAKAVMDLNVYNLYPSYKSLFSYQAENNQEVILDKEYIKDIQSNSLFLFQVTPSVYVNPNAGRSNPTKQIVDAYQMNNGKEISDPTSGFDPYNPYVNRDPRLRYSVIVPGDTLPNGKIFDPRPGSGTADAIGYAETTTNTGFNHKKYLNKEDLADPANSGINTIFMRYAEILLIYAEAKIEVNQIDQSVLDAINLIRQRPDVNMPPITSISSQDVMREILRNERMVEFAFEGLRFFDIRRWRIAEDVMPGILYGMTYADNSGQLQTISNPLFLRVFDKNKHYLWPIPYREITLNPNLTQNPNW